MTLLDQDAVRTALRNAITLAGTNATRLAKEIPRDQNYVRDFLNRKKETLGAIETARIETLLNLTAGSLVVAGPDAGINTAVLSQPPRVLAIPGRDLIGRKDLPIYAGAEGGEGHTLVHFDPIDWVKRPEPLDRVQGGYGIMVMNESMVPAFEPGDIALVNPHLPPVSGKDLVLYSSSELSGDVDAMVKRMVSPAQKQWNLKQFNPEKEFAVLKADWPIAHRTVGKYSAR